MSQLNWILGGVLAFCIAGPVGAQTVAATPVAAPAGTPATQVSVADRDYVLGPSDVIEVSVLGRTDFTTRGRVSEDGTIQLPYLGATSVSGRTTIQVAEQLVRDLEKGGYFPNPILKVEILSYASRYVTVLGHFGTPGLVPVDRAYHLSEIVAKVGGVRETGANYVVLRSGKAAERRISISTLATGDGSDDPIVSPGDKIYAPPGDVAYISGQIKSPGGFGLQPNMTLRMAISRAGGLTDQGSEKRIVVTRAGKKLSKVDMDAKVEPGDVIVIGERLF